MGRIQVRAQENARRAPGGDPAKMEVAVIVPLRAHTMATIDTNETLVRKCAESVRESAHVNRVVVSVDDPGLAERAAVFGRVMVVSRPESLSGEKVRVGEVLKFTLGEMNRLGYRPDVLVPVEITYPFRPPGILDRVVEMLVSGDFDSVIAGVPEYRVCWKKGKSGFTALTDFSRHRSERSPLHVGLPGLACAVYPPIVEKGLRYGEKLGIYEIDDPFASIEVRTPHQLESIARQLYWPGTD